MWQKVIITDQSIFFQKASLCHSATQVADVFDKHEKTPLFMYYVPLNASTNMIIEQLERSQRWINVWT